MRFVLCLLALASFAFTPPWAAAQVTFVDVAAGDLLTPVRSWGASFVDFDGDGDPDLFVSRFAADGGNVLYRNDAGTFTTIDAGPLTMGPGSIGHSWGDVDNDGDLDILTVGGTGNPNGNFDTGSGARLLLNEGGGGEGWAFTAVDAAPFTADDANEGWSGAWADIDGDGRIDFVIAHPETFVSDPSQPNHLFLQADGDGTTPAFERITDGPVVTGLDTYTVPTFSDYDLDGDPDLFIGSGPADGSLDEDNLYENVDGAFTRIAEGIIATDPRDGQVMNWQDIDNDGDLDLFVTSFLGANPVEGRDDLYRNNSDGTFTKVTDDPLTTETTGFALANTWGDVDNDGDLDVFVTTARPFGSTTIGQDRLYLNDGTGAFTRVWTTEPNTTSGATFGDIDDDGDLDLAVTSQQFPDGEPLRLYENQTDSDNAWVKFRLVGVESNRAAIGARIEVTATLEGETVTQLREVSAQNTFNGQNDLVVHVGLGDATVVDAVRVVWPSGRVDTAAELAVETTHVLTERFSTGRADGPDTGHLRLDVPFPNPSPRGVTLTLSLAAPGPIDAAVFDLAGRRIASIVQEHTPAGTRVLHWDGHSDAGSAVAAGVYLVRVETPAGAFSRRVVLVR